MHRRGVLAGLGGVLGVVPVAGGTGVDAPNSTDTPGYPGGTLVVDNAGSSALQVSVTTPAENRSASLDTTVEPGATTVRHAFVTAADGEVVTLAAQIGGDGDPTTFEFLPAGGEDGTPPEVARLTIQNAVEASAAWAATTGARSD
jgi:hypothetical protein